MSFNAKLEVDGKSFTVLSFNYGTHQETDPTGRPASIIRGGKGTFKVEASSDANIFPSWAMDSYLTKKVVLKFEKRDTKATLRTVSFEEAYLVKFNENFESTGDVPATMTCTISARVLKVEGDELVNEWV